jgi:hypothetical protein
MPGESIVTCPHCGQPADVSACLADQPALCPHCAGEFSLPLQTPPDDRADELDGHKIRQLATLRRAAYRSRSYAIIAAGACAVAAAQLLLLLVRHLRAAGWSLLATLYLILLPLSLWATWHFLGVALARHREARQTPASTPSVPPDFSTLRDGSQQLRNLEELR